MLLYVYSSLSNSQLKTIKKGFKLGFCLPNNSKQAMFYMATLQEGRKRLKNPKIMFCVVPHTSFTLSGNPIVWNFVREEWSYLVDRFSLNDRTLGRLPKTLTSDFSSEFQLQETKDFFSRYPDAGAGKVGIGIMGEGMGCLYNTLQKIKDFLHFWHLSVVYAHQILAKRGPDSTFAVEENTKTMCLKLSRFRLVKMMGWGRVFRPQVKYQILGKFLS